jgi:2-hydroxy-6-oxonona-2,4-dienedioate hydrolase
MKKQTSPIHNQTYVNTGKGPVVILLHGLFGNYKMWSRTVEALQNDFQVVVPRLPIFDLSVHNSNVKYLMKVIYEFIEWHQFKDVTIVGHAMGGQVALMYTYAHPENVSKLVLVGSTGVLEGALSQESLKSKNINYDFVQDMVSRAFHEETPDMEYFTEEIYLAVQNIPKRLMIGSLIKSSNQNTVNQFLNKINQPVLLLWGLEDKFLPPETALHFHDYLRHSELKFIQSCGHVPMMEQPDLFNRHLISFLRES